MWSAWAKERAIRFYNFFPEFIIPTEDPRRTIQRFFIPYDYHWNASDDRRISDALLRENVHDLISDEVGHDSV